MPEDILARDVSPEVRANAVGLLRGKLPQPFRTVEDVIDQLQLLLIVEGPDADRVAGLAGERLHAALHTLTHSGEGMAMFEGFGWRPEQHLPPDSAPRIEFYRLHQATLPLTSSAMLRPNERRQIARRALSEVRATSASLRRLFLGVQDAHLRRQRLADHFRRQVALNNRGQMLVNVVSFAAGQVRHTRAPADMMMGDLFAVAIGNDMLAGRLSGTYFGGNVTGSSGFKPHLRDRFNQIQHAVAGLVIAHRMGGIGTEAAKLVDRLKGEPQDVALYEAAYEAAHDLSDRNYLALSERVRAEVCDETVKPAPPLP